MAKSDLPRHVGFIPDGNRRWAQKRGLDKEAGYAQGIAPGIQLFEQCRERGIEALTAGMGGNRTLAPNRPTFVVGRKTWPQTNP